MYSVQTDHVVFEIYRWIGKKTHARSVATNDSDIMWTFSVVCYTHVCNCVCIVMYSATHAGTLSTVRMSLSFVSLATNRETNVYGDYGRRREMNIYIYVCICIMYYSVANASVYWKMRWMKNGGRWLCSNEPLVFSTLDMFEHVQQLQTNYQKISEICLQ